MYVCKWRNVLLQFLPKWLAPNLITFTGFLLTVVNFILIAYYDWDFQGANNAVHTVPRWVWSVAAINILLYYNLGEYGSTVGRWATEFILVRNCQILSILSFLVCSEHKFRCIIVIQYCILSSLIINNKIYYNKINSIKNPNTIMIFPTLLMAGVSRMHRTSHHCNSSCLHVTHLNMPSNLAMAKSFKLSAMPCVLNFVAYFLAPTTLYTFSIHLTCTLLLYFRHRWYGRQASTAHWHQWSARRALRPRFGLLLSCADTHLYVFVVRDQRFAADSYVFRYMECFS